MPLSKVVGHQYMPPSFEEDGLPSKEFLWDVYEMEVVDGSLTGMLIAKARPSHLFRHPDSAKMWNSRFVGKYAANTPHKDGYRCGRLMGKSFLTHRVVWKMCNDGLCPIQIDHKNGVRTDNRPDNLRAADNFINTKNAKRYKSNTSGVCGVYFKKGSGKWCAAVQSGNKRIFLGYFDTIGEAIAARRAGEKDAGFTARHGT